MHTATPSNAPQQARMVELLKRLAPGEGYTRSTLDDVLLMRANRPLVSTPALYQPGIVIVVQGCKRGFHAGHTYVYDARHYLVVSVPLPFEVETEASEARPLLGLIVHIDPTVVAELAMGVDTFEPQSRPNPATLYATPMDAKLADATLRLLEALDSPVEARLLGPSIVREINYRVLVGEQGGGLRAALSRDGHFGRIARVIQRIHDHYPSHLDVATLAHEASMSVPAFHVHFKSVTNNSPLQYIKAIRLHQARLLMIRSSLNAVTAAERVGYESASQFSREFKRLFGRSPVEEVRHLKDVMALTEPTPTGP